MFLCIIAPASKQSGHALEGQVFGNALALITENSVISSLFFPLMDGNAFVSRTCFRTYIDSSIFLRILGCYSEH